MAAKRGMNERIQKLRELSVTTPVHIDLERAEENTRKMPLLRNRGAERRVYENRTEKAGKDHRYLV